MRKPVFVSTLLIVAAFTAGAVLSTGCDSREEEAVMADGGPAVDGGGIGNFRGAPDAGTDVVPPGEVANLSARAGNSYVVLSWDDPKDVDFAGVAVTWNPAYEYAGYQEVGKGVKNASIQPLENGVTYIFTVSTVDFFGNHSTGRTVSATPDGTPPAAVHGLSAQVTGSDVTLLWANPTDADFDHVEITYVPGGETPTVVDKPLATATLSDLPDATYMFTVKAVDTAGNHSQGAAVLAVVDTTTP